MPQTDLIANALKLATEVHSDQTWRDGESPFLCHPLAVASLVLRFGGDETQAAAALVHDTISDPRGAPRELETRLTPEVSRLAHAFSDPELSEPSPSWNTLKRAYLAKIRELDPRALLVIGAEELHEITDLLQELRQKPPRQVWSRFAAQPMNMAWYFKEVLAVLNSGLTDSRGRALVSEMALRVRQLNEKVFEGF